VAASREAKAVVSAADGDGGAGGGVALEAKVDELSEQVAAMRDGAAQRGEAAVAAQQEIQAAEAVLSSLAVDLQAMTASPPPSEPSERSGRKTAELESKVGSLEGRLGATEATIQSMTDELRASFGETAAAAAAEAGMIAGSQLSVAAERALPADDSGSSAMELRARFEQLSASLLERWYPTTPPPPPPQLQIF